MTVDSGHSAFYTNFSGWDIYRTHAYLNQVLSSFTGANGLAFEPWTCNGGGNQGWTPPN